MFDSAQASSDLKQSRLRAGAWLVVPSVAMIFMFAMLATAGATRDPPRRPAIDGPELPPEEPIRHVERWSLPGETAARDGYRRGRRTPIQVVALGPEEIEVEVETARAFLAMRAAAAASGVELKLESGFRTHRHQRRLYRAWRKGKRRRAAKPGRSNHQSGRALDIAVKTVPDAGDWLEANAARFGFVRTVKREPWHWEYLEAPRARDARKARRGKRAKKRGKRARKSARRAARRRR